MAWRCRVSDAWRTVRQTQAVTKDSMDIFGGITGAFVGGAVALDALNKRAACPVGNITRAAITIPITCVCGSLLFRAWPITVPAVVVATGLHTWAERRTGHA